MTTKFTRTALAATAALSLLIPLSACGSIQDKIEKKVVEEVAGKMAGGDVSIDTDEGSISLTDEDGASLELGSKTLPADWPADIPMPQDYTLLQAASMTDPDEGPTLTAIITAPGEVNTMAEQLSQAMSGSAYQPTDAEPIQGEIGEITTDVRFYESSQHSVMVNVSNITEDEGTVTIQYYVTDPKQE